MFIAFIAAKMGGRKFVTLFWRGVQSFVMNCELGGEGINFTRKSRDVIYGQPLSAVIKVYIETEIWVTFVHEDQEKVCARRSC